MRSWIKQYTGHGLSSARSICRKIDANLAPAGLTYRSRSGYWRKTSIRLDRQVWPSDAFIEHIEEFSIPIEIFINSSLFIEIDQICHKIKGSFSVSIIKQKLYYIYQSNISWNQSSFLKYIKIIVNKSELCPLGGDHRRPRPLFSLLTRWTQRKCRPSPGRGYCGCIVFVFMLNYAYC